MDGILLITIDSFRADIVSGSSFSETYQRLSDDFHSPTSAWSHGVATPFAFPVILTGKNATGDGSLDADATTLAEIADSSAGFPNNPHLSE